MSNHNAVAHAVRRALVMAGTFLGVAAVAYAQEPNQEQSAAQEVVVTGSRIAAPNITSTSPIQVVTSEDIQLGGRADITDVINELPQIYSNMMGQDLGNRTSGLTTPGGVSTADLRGLGPNRTLVLVDGRRLGAGSPNTAIQSPAPDIDQIPAALVERIDVQRGCSRSRTSIRSTAARTTVTAPRSTSSPARISRTTRAISPRTSATCSRMACRAAAVISAAAS
jgi:outer membrane receptor for ferrienterochelin and colicin